jgi:hypothetical protein
MDEYKGVAKDPEKLKAQVMSELPDGSVSASFVRNIVAQGDDFYYKFEELYTPYLKDPVIIRAFYDAIKKGLGRSSKSQVKSTTLRKRKPEPSVELPNKNTNVLNGGRKTRKTRKTRKSRKKRKTRKTRKKSRRKRVTTK